MRLGLLLAMCLLAGCSPAGLALVGTAVGIAAEATGLTDNLINEYESLKGKRLAPIASPVPSPNIH